MPIVTAQRIQDGDMTEPGRSDADRDEDDRMTSQNEGEADREEATSKGQQRDLEQSSGTSETKAGKNLRTKIVISNMADQGSD